MDATLLVVDDDRHLCRILQKALSGEGYRVLTAHDGEQALQAVRQAEPDLVVLDVLLPRQDGFDVLRQIRALPEPLGRVPALLITGCRVTSQYEERAAALDAAAILGKPVPLRVLLGMVRQSLKSRAPRAPGRRRGGPPLEGSLSEIGFPHLLHHLHGLRATGVLLLSSGKKRKAIQLREGYPVAVKSNLVGECLGNFLVRRGRLERDAFEESVRRMKKGEGLQGEILVAMEVMTEEEIARALEEQVKEKLFEIFCWKSGEFRFEKGGRLKRTESMALDASPASLVVEGVRRGFPIERIDDFLREHADRFVVRGEAPFFRFQELALSAEEREHFGGLDGGRSLGDFLALDAGVRRTLYALLAVEMLHLRGAPGEGELLLEQEATQPEASDAVDERGIRTELAALAERFRRQDHFGVLGVSPDADEAEVRSAYEELAARTHPDRFSGASNAVRQLAEEVFGRVAEAHEVLSNQERRVEYTLQRQRGERRQKQQDGDQRAIEAEMAFQRGEAKLRARDYEDALVHFGRALQLVPREGEYHAHYGWCLHLSHPDDPGLLEEAIEHVERGLKLARDHEKPYLFLGRLYKVVGRGSAAEKLFTRAVQIRPDSVEALRELRLINMRRRRKGLIRRLLRRS